MSFRCRGALVSVLAVSLLCGRLPAEEAARVPAWVVRELETIRQAVGPVVAGSSLDSQPDAGEPPSDFGRTYRRIAGDDRALPTPSYESRPSLPTVDPHQRYAAALRDAARVLELAAADLEDAEAYGEADELRRRARKLRQGARQGAESAANSPASE